MAHRRIDHLFYSEIAKDNSIEFCKSKFSRNFSGGVEQAPINSHEISVSALYFSLENIELPKVAQQYPMWSYDQQREQAVRNIEIRSAYNIINGYLPELDRVPVFEKDWITVETETGKQMATWNGERFETRQELWNNFEKLAKSKGQWTQELEQEKNDQSIMERSILNGDAIGGATWLSHESGLTRYLQTWELKENGHVITKQFDVGLVHGNDFSKIESKKLLESLRLRTEGHEIQDHPVSANTFLSKQKIEFKEVSALIKNQNNISYGADLKSNQVRGIVNDASRFAFDTTRQLIQDSTSSAIALGVHVYDHIKKNIGEKKKKKDLLYMAEAVEFSNRGRNNVNKEVRILIHKKFTEFREAKKILTFVQSGVGVGAGIFVLETLTRELPKSLRNIEKKRMKMLRRKERKLVKKRESQGSEKTRLFAPSIKDSYKKEMRIKKQWKKDGSEALGKKVVRVEKKKTLRREKKRKSSKEKRIHLSKREIIIVQEHSRRPKRERRLKFVIGMLLRRLTKERVSLKNTAAKKKEKRVYSKKEMKQARVEGRIFKTAEARKKEVRMQKKKEKVMVLNFSFALAFWMLFLSESRDDNRAMILKQKGETERSQSGQSEEPRPWILFSIIYYLAMIRESGARHSPQQKKTAKKKRKKLQKSMPQSGIIFAFPS